MRIFMIFFVSGKLQAETKINYHPTKPMEPNGTESGIFRKNQANATAADALVPDVIRPSVAIV